MTDAFYASIEDPYCYAGTSVLRNKAGIRDAQEFLEFEALSYAGRALRPLPSGRFGVCHFKAVHRHLFGGVYRWAGRFRTVQIHKQNATFCRPEHIDRQMVLLFEELSAKGYLRGLNRRLFVVQAADFLATLNHIHPFREGNGRAQMAFLAALAWRAGHPLDFATLDENAFLEAMILSFHGRMEALEHQLQRLVG